MTGLYAHGAILAALLQRKMSGKGQKIDCNLLSTQIVALLNIGSNYLNAGVEGRRLGTEHESIVPYQAFKTKDGRYFVVGAASDEQFKKLCKLIGLSKLPRQEEYATNANRVKNREALIETIKQRFLKKDLKYWQKTLNDPSLPCGPVNTIAEAFAHPQVRHLGLVQELYHPETGAIKVAGPAVHYSETVNRIRSPPPILGEHTKEVLSNVLNVSEEELKRLKEEKAIDYVEKKTN
ncbi:unnamed protein product [Toxocara canis]|uniref:Succinate--hydroxymethylglutarate CoA-transferase n=1 Tax=Toxocara canis TaxID=6265 RepID=A0A183U108_TOXCA|nr:unnamed protein product [Toxocara canis]